MSDQEKGVSVVATPGRTPSRHHFANGAGADVRNEGHLFVSDVDSKTIAIFAPGSWVSVKVNR